MRGGVGVLVTVGITVKGLGSTIEDSLVDFNKYHEIKKIASTANKSNK